MPPCLLRRTGQLFATEAAVSGLLQAAERRVAAAAVKSETARATAAAAAAALPVLTSRLKNIALIDESRVDQASA